VFETLMYYNLCFWSSGSRKNRIRRKHYLRRFCGRTGLPDCCMWKWFHMWVV